MYNTTFTWTLKRGFIDMDSIEEPCVRAAMEKVQALLEEGNSSLALAALPPLSFEFSCSQMDTPENPYFPQDSEVFLDLDASNSHIGLALRGGRMYLTAVVQFSMDLLQEVKDLEAFNEWLADEGAPFACALLGGFSFVEDDGCTLLAH